MTEEKMDRVYEVFEKGGELIVKGKLDSKLEPNFLAKSPDGDLFLLLGENGIYELLKGSIEKGLRFCEIRGTTVYNGRISVIFSQDGSLGVITDPGLDECNPSYESIEDQRIQELNSVLGRIIE